MKIFDCFMYFDEEIVLDIRLNTLDKFVDYFVIVESIYNHKGEERDLKFNLKKFEKFKDKIIYIIYDKIPHEIKKIEKHDSEEEKSNKYILNALYRENGQRNFVTEGLNKANKNDIIIISDVDEIPKLSEINFQNIKKKIIIFEQNMFYYKLNLKLPNKIWAGSKACKKKYLISPQWLRNIKEKIYSKWRFDIIFSNKKYNSIYKIKDGGWHFSNIKTPAAIHHKLKSYLHHREFDEVPLSVKEIENIMINKQAIYDLSVDKRTNKVANGAILETFEINKLPNYIKSNLNNFKEWID